MCRLGTKLKNRGVSAVEKEAGAAGRRPCGHHGWNEYALKVVCAKLLSPTVCHQYIKYKIANFMCVNHQLTDNVWNNEIERH